MAEPLRCPGCGEPVAPEWTFCPACERPLAESRCPGCGLAIKPHWKRCPGCGRRLACAACGRLLPPAASECPHCWPAGGPGETGDRYVEPLTGMEFVFVKGGAYAMGDLFEVGWDNETPLREVVIEDFYLAKTPVTQGQWLKVMAENPSHFRLGEDYPVEQVSWADVQEFIRRLRERSPGAAEFRLPTEAEWERAARGGLDGATYAWGDRYYDPLEGWRANTWQGAFPMRDTAEDGHHGTAPVGCYPPNGFGLVDMIGNVWEYTRDLWVPGHPAGPQADPEGPPAELTARFADASGTRLVIKGGSWLCAPNFCARYRPAARQPQERDLGAGHLGFRTVLRTPPS